MPDGRATIAVFDIGNVLLDWNPRYLYRQVFADAARMEWFLREVLTPAWILETDRGKSFQDAVAERTARYPDLAAEIEAFDGRWLETIRGPIAPSVDMLDALRARGVPVYAITNFSAEKFGLACAEFPFLGGFDGVIVSGDEKLVKPDPAIYRLLLERYRLSAADCLFIDDVAANVEAARGVGMYGHHFKDPDGLADQLRHHGFPV
ncbi:MAG: HAD family hydrolase [Xanthobacteraceae bacterium]|jgi:2-haloacid dehalogenase